MASDDHGTGLEATLSNAEAEVTEEVYVLRLFVAGSTPRSLRAIANIRAVCEEYLQGRYEIEIFDVYQQPEMAESEQIIAAPTLIKKLPLPLRQLIGDMNDVERVLAGLDLRPRG